MSILQFYTDGACSGNPGKGGWACIEVTPIGIRVTSNNANLTTNNIMEMSAVLEALLTVCFKSAAEIDQFEQATIYTDSAYIANCINQGWYKTWFKNGWKTSKNEPVKNKELWEDLLSAYFQAQQLLPLRIELVKGHSDNHYNNLADTLAVAARKGEIHNHEMIYRSDI